jgi:hypothetical protein
MRQRIFSHFQDYLIQYISHQYQDLLYCNSSQYILSTYNSQYNNNVVLAMTMSNSGIVIARTYITEEIYRKHNNEISCMRNVKDLISLPFKKIFLSVKDSLIFWHISQRII